MSSFFVAGTDTDVGKTTACCAIIQALQAKGVRIVGYKPIACSCEEGIYPVENQSNESQTDYDADNNSDVLALMDATNEPVSYQEVNSYTFAHSLSMLTRDKSRIKLSKINCILAIGVYGINALATSTENIFPKLELAVIFIYLIIFA